MVTASSGAERAALSKNRLRSDRRWRARRVFSSSISSVSGSAATSKPALTIARRRAVASTAPGTYSTVTASATTLPRTATTRSTRVTQEAHVIPSMGRVMLCGLVSTAIVLLLHRSGARAGQAVELEQLAEHLFLAPLAHALDDTRTQVALQHSRLQLFQCTPDGIRLPQDVDAVLVLLHHAPDAGEVAVNVVEPPQNIGAHVVFHVFPLNTPTQGVWVPAQNTTSRGP